MCIRDSAQTVSERDHQLGEIQKRRRSYRHDEETSAFKTPMQRPQASFMRRLREMREDREGERQIEALVERETLGQEV